MNENNSSDCVQASSVNMFKNRIDKYLVRSGYIKSSTGELSISHGPPFNVFLRWQFHLWHLSTCFAHMCL